MDLLAFGQFLREARQQRELSLDDAVKTLKIQRRILEAFEEGDFSLGGSPVQVRGMLRNYARFLRLEEDIVLQHYETALIPAPATSRWRKKATEETQAVKPATQPRRDTLTAIPLSGGGRRNGGVRFAWVGGLLRSLVGLGLIGVIIFSVGQILGHTPPPEGGQPTLAAQIGTLDPTLATATNTPSLTPEEFVPTPTRLFAMGANGIDIQLSFVQRSWVRVIGDGTEQFAGIVRPDEIQTYNAQEGFEITLANAAAVELTVNGQEQAAFGTRGTQVLILVNSAGIQVIQPGATATIDTTRVISPESLTITETPDPALIASPAIEASATLLAPTPIGAEIVPTQTPASTETAVMENITLTPFNVANAETTTDSATPVPTLTPFLPNIAPTAESISATTIETTSVPTLTPFLFAPLTPTPEGFVPEQDATALPSPTTSLDFVTVTAAENVASQNTVQTIPTTTQVQSIAPTGTATVTARPSATSTNTSTPTATRTPDIRPTAIVPLRITQSGLPTRKAP